MISRLRIKGRILLTGNVGLMSLYLADAVLFWLCLNFIVVIYELVLNEEKFVYLDYALGFLMFLISFCLFWQIRLGADRFFFRHSQRCGAKASDIFCYFRPSRAFSALIFALKLTFLHLLFAIVAFLPFALSIVFLVYLLKNQISLSVGMVLTVGTLCFFLSGALFFRNLSDVLFLARYHYVKGDCFSFGQLIRISQLEMKNNRLTLRKLRFSFLGWFLLCFLIFPIGYVWSYYNQTLAVAAGEFIDY